ncbi:hypothetical protein THASP1DRAFT_24395 [Thamnocephalis sphaerospora]|uniref:Secreted protein n=1 Tax=Thamnocephalis sphaerospora TaxID=78915 RepID=A0A4P9XNG2_9FUNG|nr:hypothetical protein THASP1DRAFT_24395 [Thamnocephalis sphaerospora]|eukprot:RKP07465.1 hypothetical protein THASP1DRAFT_24395 [Thamnocephalis sphaerospora]
MLFPRVILSLLSVGALAVSAQEASDKCQAAMTGKDVSPPCLFFSKDKDARGYFDARCGKPADGKPNHICSQEQRATALNMLERSCKTELEQGHDIATNLHFLWFHLSGREAVSCLKNDDGQYCELDNNGVKTRTVLTMEPTCDACTKKAWNAARSAKAEGQKIGKSDPQAALKALLAKVAEKCQFSESTSDATAPEDSAAGHSAHASLAAVAIAALASVFSAAL